MELLHAGHHDATDGRRDHTSRRNRHEKEMTPQHLSPKIGATEDNLCTRPPRGGAEGSNTHGVATPTAPCFRFSQIEDFSARVFCR
uniref:Uncharacterized protein n=1 Tax=Aegilops tauschii subsp. strangulata TaxID=200361 RepID=A0A453GG46_AEGTS